MIKLIKTAKTTLLPLTLALSHVAVSGAVAEFAHETRPDWKDHWSFKPLAQKDGPQTLDAFIDAKLAEKGLRRSPAAEAATWLRRVTLDLTGLPPTPEEVAEFHRHERGRPTFVDAPTISLTEEVTSQTGAPRRQRRHRRGR